MPKKSGSSPHKNPSAMKWILNKLDEHDMRLQDIYQLLRELKRELDINNRQIILDIMQGEAPFSPPDEMPSSPPEETDNA